MCDFKKEEDNETLKGIINEAYIHRFDITEDTNIKLFIRNVSIYSIIINAGDEERANFIKNIRTKSQIDISDEELVYELIKKNYTKLSAYKDNTDLPDAFEDSIENNYYNIKKLKKIKYTRCILHINTK
ncbi:MAG: hypothetical protein ACRCXT_05595 [Paraclostridium sp.]